MKKFVKGLNIEHQKFQYLCPKFPQISNMKLKEGMAISPQIQQLFNDKFQGAFEQREKDAWHVFKATVRSFLGNEISDDYKQIFKDIVR